MNLDLRRRQRQHAWQKAAQKGEDVFTMKIDPCRGKLSLFGGAFSHFHANGQLFAVGRERKVKDPDELSDADTIIWISIAKIANYIHLPNWIHTHAFGEFFSFKLFWYCSFLMQTRTHQSHKRCRNHISGMRAFLHNTFSPRQIVSLPVHLSVSMLRRHCRRRFFEWVSSAFFFRAGALHRGYGVFI